MTTDPRTVLIVDVIARHRAGKLSRRQVIGVLGGLGLSAAAAPWLLDQDASVARASGAAGGHAGHMVPVSAQEGTPQPVATPTLGERADGTRLWKVTAGGGSPEELIESLAFLPGEITVNAGDAIFFDLHGFHNVHFLSGQEPPPLIVPAPASGTPTGGPPPLIVNPEVVFPSGGTTYDGTGVVNSGAPLGPMEPFVLTFTTPGTYEYWCSIHVPVMKATVIVQEAGAAYPMERADYDRIAAERLAALIETARAKIVDYGAATPTAEAAVEVTAGFAEGQVEANGFFPQRVTIPVGGRVRWVVRSAPVTPHIVTFLGGAEALEFLQPIETAGGPPVLALNPQLVVPAGGATYSGQGIANSGLLGGPDGRIEYELTFDTPGSYRYYCAIHGDPEGGMNGDVVVE